VLRSMPREQVPGALDEMMQGYESPESWGIAAEFLGRRRRIELFGFARRRRHAIAKLALSDEIRRRLS